MNAIDFINSFDSTGQIDMKSLIEHTNIRAFSEELVNLSRQGQCHRFALAFLQNLIEITKQDNSGVSSKLRLACYLVAEHRNLRDILLIWEAKNLNFDTYCGIDAQLLAASGITQTIQYLSTQSGENAESAKKYIEKCTDELDDLDQYYSLNEYPWYIDDE